MSTDTNRLERRARQRFEVHLPLAINVDGRTMAGFSQDLSGSGMFFYAEAALPEGAIIELTFTMPAEVTLSEAMRVRCRGRVLRVVPSNDAQRNGVAVHLDSYQYLPSLEEEQTSGLARISSSKHDDDSLGAIPH